MSSLRPPSRCSSGGLSAQGFSIRVARIRRESTWSHSQSSPCRRSLLLSMDVGCCCGCGCGCRGLPVWSVIMGSPVVVKTFADGGWFLRCSQRGVRMTVRVFLRLVGLAVPSKASVSVYRRYGIRLYWNSSLFFSMPEKVHLILTLASV